MRNILGYLARLIMIVIGVFAVVLLVVGVVRFAENRSNYNDKGKDSTEKNDSDKSGAKSDNTKDISTDSTAGNSSDADNNNSTKNENKDIISESGTASQSDSTPSSVTSATPNTNAEEQSPGTSAASLPATGSSMLSINLFIASSLGLYAIHLKSKDHYFNLD